jgi:hypothetical protein
MKSYKPVLFEEEGYRDVFTCGEYDGVFRYLAGEARVVEHRGKKFLYHTASTKEHCSGQPIVDAVSGCVLAVHTQGFPGGHGENVAELLPLKFLADFGKSTPSRGGLQRD